MGNRSLSRTTQQGSGDDRCLDRNDGAAELEPAERPAPFQARPGGRTNRRAKWHVRLDKRGLAGQCRIMNRRAIGMALAATLIPLAAPAAAQEPDNAVSCIYSAFSPEDREIALLLIAREISQGGKFSPSSRNVVSVEALIDDGSAQCGARFHWPKGRSEAARDFTMTALLGEAIDQSLQASGRTVAPL